MTLRENPFRAPGGWYWSDENENVYGPYTCQADALRGVLRHVDGVLGWLRLKDGLKRACGRA